ncbi:MAG: 3-isopropylmalate dehydratase large subunit [Candidatus Ranarchaeia archaeon]
MCSLTFVEKVFASALNKPKLQAGEIVEAPIDVALSHDNAGLVIKKFHELGATEVWDPSRVAIILDHRVPANNEQTAKTHQAIRQFVREQGIRSFYDIDRGVCHQVLHEQGHVAPGEIIVGTDSHTTMHGALGSFSTGIGATEMAGVWATGETWFRVPESLQIEITGSLGRYIMAKDIVLHIIGSLGADGATYCAIEYTGGLAARLTLSERFTLCNMAVEMGAKSAAFKADEKTFLYLKRVNAKVESERIRWADQGAEYKAKYTFDVSSLEPQVACPHAVDNVRPVSEVANTGIDQALIGTCTNGRIEDLRAAAEILRGRVVADGVRLLVIPASSSVYLQAAEEGLLSLFVRSGAVICNPGCGPCLGAHQGILAPHEVCISSSNRNFRGRMGSAQAKVYLASPVTVAASAVRGEITDPRLLVE